MSDESRTVTPTKEQLEKALHDAYAVLVETRGLDVPERRRAAKRCRAIADLGHALGFWKLPAGWVR